MTLDEVKELVYPLPSFILDDEINCYFKYANLVQKGLIIDLGTGWGKSMLALAASNPNNKVITCDTGAYPIVQGWAADESEYCRKITDLTKKVHLKRVVLYLGTAQQLIDQDLDLIDLLHIDNWSEINQVDSTDWLQKYVDKVKSGGFLLFRNYGRADREGYTESVNQVTKELKQIEHVGLMEIFQKI